MTRRQALVHRSFLLDDIVARKLPALLAKVRASTCRFGVAYDAPHSTRRSGCGGFHDTSRQDPRVLLLRFSPHGAPSLPEPVRDRSDTLHGRGDFAAGGAGRDARFHGV